MHGLVQLSDNTFFKYTSDKKNYLASLQDFLFNLEGYPKKICSALHNI